MLFGSFYTMVVVVDRCDMELLRCSRQDCDYRTTSEAKLARHAARHAEQPDRPWLCPLCGQVSCDWSDDRCTHL